MIGRLWIARNVDRVRRLVRRSGSVVETMSRLGTPITNQAGAIASGSEHVYAIALNRGDRITSVTFVSGTTAADTPTNYWFTLRDKDRRLLGITADQTTGAWAASTEKTLALATPVVASYDGVHYLGVMVKATTPPSVLGLTSSSTLNGLAPVIAVKTSSTALTDPASAQTQITAYANLSVEAYAYCS